MHSSESFMFVVLIYLNINLQNTKEMSQDITSWIHEFLQDVFSEKFLERFPKKKSAVFLQNIYEEVFGWIFLVFL